MDRTSHMPLVGIAALLSGIVGIQLYLARDAIREYPGTLQWVWACAVVAESAALIIFLMALVKYCLNKFSDFLLELSGYEPEDTGIGSEDT